MASSTRHVIFGAGQVGAPLAHLLLSRGLNVAVAKRTAAGIPSGATPIQGDASDVDFCRRAVAGASTVYHCMNPPYSTRLWAELVPRYMSNLIDACARSHARLVVLDNLYMLGKPSGRPFTEESQANPCSRKGEIRAQAAELLFAAQKRGDLRATIGRASDFYGPGGTLTLLGDHFWPRALHGRKAQVIVDPDAIHTYHYIPDVVLGLATLGTASDDAFGRPWMLPCQPASSLRVLLHRLEREFGEPIRIQVLPTWMLKGVALFMPVLREMPEMAYQWAEPFVVSDAAFRARFGVVPEDNTRAAVETVAWAQGHYGIGL